MKKVILPFLFFSSIFFMSVLFIPIPVAYAQTALATSTDSTGSADKVETYKARVVSVVNNGSQSIPGTGVSSQDQTVTAKILDGDEVGKEVTVDNNYIMLNAGDEFYLIHDTNLSDGTDYYSVSDPYRLPALCVLLGIFLVCVFLFGGRQGMRGLISLAGGLLLIFYVLLPAILAGYSPILVSIGVAALIVIVGSYITHGFNRTTTSAVVGMIVTIAITGFLAYVAVGYTKLSGFSNEEAVYLNFNTNGSINFAGLLLGGILIGLLGVLYDIAISQAISVEELHRIGPHVPWTHVYRRAIRIGREHIGALINTLAIAYVGVSLPLLLFLYSSSPDWALSLNKEIFATEIVRILVGSIGLVLAVPITTFISSYMLARDRRGKKVGGVAGSTPADMAIVHMEEKAMEHMGHHH
jgi:uncharacterized membrane protein